MANDDGSYFTTVAGVIQFDVEGRDLDSGQHVRDATIRSLASGDNVRITFWPDFEDAEFEKGDFIVVDGKMTPRSVGGQTYFNLSARRLSIVPQEKPKEREVVNKSEKKAAF